MNPPTTTTTTPPPPPPHINEALLIGSSVCTFTVQQLSLVAGLGTRLYSTIVQCYSIDPSVLNTPDLAVDLVNVTRDHNQRIKVNEL